MSRTEHRDWPSPSPQTADGCFSAGAAIRAAPQQRSQSQYKRRGDGKIGKQIRHVSLPTMPAALPTSSNPIKPDGDAELMLNLPSIEEVIDNLGPLRALGAAKVHDVDEGVQSSHGSQSRECRCKLQDENDNLKSQLRATRSEIQQLTRQLEEEKRAARERDAEVDRALAKAESRVQEARARASVARDFEEGDADDTQKIIARFRDVIDAADEFAFHLMTKSREQDVNIPIGATSIQTLAHPSKDTILPYVSKMRDLEVSSDIVILQALAFVVFTFLNETVFTPFCPGPSLTQDAEKHVFEICKRVASKESQERFGRWRGMLYQAVQPDDQPINGLANDLLHSTSTALRALLPPSAPSSMSVEDDRISKIRATTVIAAAIEFQNSVRVDYVSYEYSVFLPPRGENYDPSTQEIADMGSDEVAGLGHSASGGKTGQIFLSTSVGLQASRKGSRKETLIKATVVVA